MKHFGDITKIDGAKVPVVDIITGGSPCQDLSVAGKRAGLAGERSGLFMDQIRIIKEMRENDRTSGRANEFIRPRYMVWENVPGAFSSNNGEDFRAVLEETARVADKGAVIPRPANGKWTPSGCIMGDGWSIAWRVHDAQFWGVPQRRKRIALVADFGGATAPEILFERKGMSRDFEPSGTAGKETAGTVGTGIEAASGIIGCDVYNQELTGDIAASLTAACGGTNTSGAKVLSFQERAGKPGGGKGILIQNERTGALSTLNNQMICGFDAYNQTSTGDVAMPLRNKAADSDHIPVVYGICSDNSNSMKSNNPHSGIYEAETARTLDLNGGSPACNQGGMAVVSMMSKQQSMNVQEEKAAALGANDYKEPQVVCIEGNGSRPSHRGDGYAESETMYTLNAVEQHAVSYAVENHTQDARYNVGEINQPVSANKNGQSEVVMTYGLDRASYNQGKNAKFGISVEEEKIGAQVAKGPGAVASFYPQMKAESQCYREDDVSNTLVNGTNSSFQNGVVQSVVRRLTPMECERLQGYPDHWTDIGDWVDSNGKTHKGDADSPRYKALGNSIALPFWRWMAERMVQHIPGQPTMASLFDGIGGFPLVFSRCGCNPVWASEIEEFPIAVTKYHFGEE